MASRRSFQWPWSPNSPQDSPSLYSSHDGKFSSTLADAVKYYAECNPYPISGFPLANTCLDTGFMHPRTPPLPPQAYTTFDSKREVTTLEAVLTRVEEHSQIVETADRLRYNRQLPAPQRRWRPLIAALLVMNLCALSFIVLAVYIGVSPTDPLWKSTFWCGFANSLPKSLVNGAFVFIVAAAGMTSFAQRYLQGAWTILLYSFFLFVMGNIIGAVSHGRNITVVVCQD